MIQVVCDRCHQILPRTDIYRLMVRMVDAPQTENWTTDERFDPEKRTLFNVELCALLRRLTDFS